MELDPKWAVAEVPYSRLASAVRPVRFATTSRTCERFLTDTPQAQLCFEPPGSETQAIFLNFVDRFTASPLRLVTLWDDHLARFSSHGITPPEGAFVGNRTATVEDGLPELRGRKDVYLLIASELGSAGMLTANLSGMVSPAALADRLTTDFGRQFVRFTSPRST